MSIPYAGHVSSDPIFSSIKELFGRGTRLGSGRYC